METEELPIVLGRVGIFLGDEVVFSLNLTGSQRDFEFGSQTAKSDESSKRTETEVYSRDFKSRIWSFGST